VTLMLPMRMQRLRCGIFSLILPVCRYRQPRCVLAAVCVCVCVCEYGAVMTGVAWTVTVHPCEWLRVCQVKCPASFLQVRPVCDHRSFPVSSTLGACHIALWHLTLLKRAH